MEIFYFTSAGNSLMVAKHIGGELKWTIIRKGYRDEAGSKSKLFCGDDI